MDIDLRRRFFAEEVACASNIRTPALVDALAQVPRERFLPPGPWMIVTEGDFRGGPRQTPDADVRHVYHNIAIGIDPKRMLFNGQPGTLGLFIDALALAPGARVLHVGCGLGYYTALIAHCVGASGRVVAFDVDYALASEARANLAAFNWVDVRHADATAPLEEAFDAILVNAGVTHPQDAWLDALAPGGRVVMPLTATMGPMGPTIGKGPVLLLTKDREDADLSARGVGFVAIYSGVGLRDQALNDTLGQALARNPFAPVKRLRRDAHEPAPSCWHHGDRFCFSLD